MERVFKNELKTRRGFPDVLGATLDKHGCNFAIYSKNAGSVSLILFNKDSIKNSTIIIPLDKSINKTENIWHIYIHGVKKGQIYGYSISELDSHKW